MLSIGGKSNKNYECLLSSIKRRDFVWREKKKNGNWKEKKKKVSWNFNNFGEIVWCVFYTKKSHEIY